MCKSLSFDDGFDTALRDLAAIFGDAIAEINSQSRRLDEEDDDPLIEFEPLEIEIPLIFPAVGDRLDDLLEKLSFSRMKFSQVGATVF